MILGYEVNDNLVSLNNLINCKKVLNNYKDKIVLPLDFVCEDGNKDINEINKNDNCMDIGPKTIRLFRKELKEAKRVILNGPMGIFEDKKYAKGTREIFNILCEYKIKTVVGGGDSASAVNKLGYDGMFYHVSTGGGATMEYLEKRKLEGIEVIDDAKK